jgi:hypothetical protein
MAVRLDRRQGNSLDRFMYRHYLGSAMLIGLVCCVWLVCVLAEHAPSSWLAFGGAVAVNLLIQPLALLMRWSATRKIVLGLCGHLVYAGQRVPEEELADMAPSERRSLTWYFVIQGFVLLLIGVATSLGCAWPLVRAVLT